MTENALQALCRVGVIEPLAHGIAEALGDGWAVKRAWDSGFDLIRGGQACLRGLIWGGEPYRSRTWLQVSYHDLLSPAPVIRRIGLNTAPAKIAARIQRELLA